MDKNLKMPPGGPLPLKSSPTSRLGFARALPIPEDRVPTAKKQSALWSLTKPALPTLPPVKSQPWVRNEIDRFILSRLETKGLTPSPEADRRA